MTNRKKKIRIKWKAVIPALVCLFLFLYLIISLIVHFVSGRVDYNIQTIGDLSGKETYKIISKENRENPKMMAEYLFYGESLDLYSGKYELDIASEKTLTGKTVVCKNLLDNKDVRFENISGCIDDQIVLNKLDDGFYAVYLENKDATLSRVYMKNSIVKDNKLTTVTRNGKNKQIELIANSEYFDSADGKQKLLDNNYLYINVKTIDAKDNVEYDIVLNSEPSLTITGISLEGVVAHDISEGYEMFELASKVKEILEAKGLKVLLPKDSYNQDIMFYGEGSTLQAAYASKAKYYIDFDMYQYSDNICIVYSSKSADKFSNFIFDSMKAKTSLYNANGQTEPSALDGLFEDENVISESGGYALGASERSELASSNKSFAYHNLRGMNTIIVVPGSLCSRESGELYLANRDKAPQAIADGILAYLEN